MVIRLDEIIAKGAQNLEKKFMGGVTPESAQKAIRETAQEVERQMDEIARVGVEKVKMANEQAMNAMKEAHLKELAAKDRENLSLRQANEEITKENAEFASKIAKFMKRVKNGLTYKEIKTLEDGSKVYEKHSLNGAKAVKTVNKDGITTQVNIELADKTFRRTSYNPLTQKPTRTVTNATKDGETVEILYDSYGRGGKPRILNEKKSKVKVKPTIVSRNTENVNENYVKVKTNYSDGSRMEAEVNKQTNEITEWQKWVNSNSFGADEWYSKDLRTGIIYKGKRVAGVNGKRGYDKRVVISPRGIVRTMPYARHEDELTGLITNVNRMTFPKSSPVKRVDSFIAEGSNVSSKEIVRMKDGTVYEMTNYKIVPSNRELRPGGGLEVDAPQNVVKTAKDGTRTEMPQEEIMPWLESFHPDFNFHLMRK